MKERIFKLRIEVKGQLIRQCDTSLDISILYFTKYPQEKNIEFLDVLVKSIRKLESVKMITVNMIDRDFDNYQNENFISSWKFHTDNGEEWKNAPYKDQRYNFDNHISMNFKEVKEKIKSLNDQLYYTYLQALKQAQPEEINK